MQVPGFRVASGVQSVVFARSKCLPGVFAGGQGLGGYIVSILDKLSPGVYRILCRNQLRRGYLHDTLSEPYDWRVVVMFSFSPNDGVPQLLVLLLPLEGVVGSEVLFG